jgi:hypothetical protein
MKQVFSSFPALILLLLAAARADGWVLDFTHSATRGAKAGLPVTRLGDLDRDGYGASAASGSSAATPWATSRTWPRTR